MLANMVSPPPSGGTVLTCRIDPIGGIARNVRMPILTRDPFGSRVCLDDEDFRMLSGHAWRRRVDVQLAETATEFLVRFGAERLIAKNSTKQFISVVDLLKLLPAQWHGEIDAPDFRDDRRGCLAN